MAYLASENDIPNTYASRLEGVFLVLVIVRWLSKTSRCEIFLVIRVSRSRDAFDAAHRLF
jgi:hypothetical protein